MSATEDMSWPTPRVTPQEDEAWRDLFDRAADRIAERLAAAPDDRPLLDMKQLAVRLAISDRSARSLVNQDGGRAPRLASIVVGDGSRRVEPAAVDRYLAEQR